MKMLITGAAGQLGGQLEADWANRYEVAAAAKDELDITQLDRVMEAVGQLKPDIIVHAAAYTNVEQAENEPDAAYRVNMLGTRNIAIAAEEQGARLVYISTDYVFDGKKGSPYHEFDEPNPINVYGHSKLAGERIAAAMCRRTYVLRTAWLYGRGDSHFAYTMLSLARTRGSLSVVVDQKGSPTTVTELSRFIGSLLSTEAYGLYHAANRGGCSRYDFVRELLNYAKLHEVKLKPARSDEFVTAAARPANSALDDWMVRLNGLTPMADWKRALHAYLDKTL